MNIIQLLFSAKGRLRRRDWWLTCICLGIVNIVVEFAVHQLVSGNPPGAFFTDLGGWTKFDPTPFNMFLWTYFILMIWPGICLSAKRWHDRGRPGWLAGVLMVITYTCLFAQVTYGPTAAGGTEGVNWPVYGAAALVSLVVSIWQFVELGCLDGTKGPNTYGPSPKGAGGSSDVF